MSNFNHPLKHDGKNSNELTDEQIKRINEFLVGFAGDGEIRLIIENGTVIEIYIRKIDKYEA